MSNASMMLPMATFAGALIAAAGWGAIGLAQQTPQKVEIMRVVGCLKHEAAAWLLKDATDPVSPPPSGPSTVPPPGGAAAAPSPPETGRNQYKLIGVAEFNLPSRENQRVAVTGLFIKATPVSRINVTTVVPVAPSCGTAGR